jgi:hypothetical protein
MRLEPRATETRSANDQGGSILPMHCPVRPISATVTAGSDDGACDRRINVVRRTGMALAPQVSGKQVTGLVLRCRVLDSARETLQRHEAFEERKQ